MEKVMATAQQKSYLRKLGYIGKPKKLTKQEASAEIKRLISRNRNNYRLLCEIMPHARKKRNRG